MQLPKFVKMVEVSPRDGLQNEPKAIPSLVKIDLINRLSLTGLRVIEVSSFVSAKRIPQLADASEVLLGIEQVPGIHYPVLVPNLQGFNNALAAGAKEIAVFCSASEKFSEKNINCSIAESMQRVDEVAQAAKARGIPMRGYLSCTLGCPYEGDIKPSQVVPLVERMAQAGCYEISLADTIGIATPQKTQDLFLAVSRKVPMQRLAAHFHDTYGQALANLLAALEVGVAVIDSSVSGLGGCPYAHGATGNVASEDVLYMLNGLGIDTGVDLLKLVGVGQFICKTLGKASGSKVTTALSAQ